MKWKKLKSGMAIPETKVLCVDTKHNYYVAHIFQEESSSTGFVCMDNNDGEYDCVAFADINNSRWKSPQSELPSNYSKVLCQSIDGRIMLGSLTELDGYYLSQNEDELYTNVVAWQPVEKYQFNAKIIRFERWVALAAICTLSIVGSKFIDLVTNNNSTTYAQSPPSLDLPVDCGVDQLCRHEKDIDDTMVFLNDDPWMQKADIIEIAYDGYMYRENFSPDRFFIDEHNCKHYVDEGGQTYIISDYELYVVGKDAGYYRCTSDFFLNFLYAGFDAQVLDFIEKEPHGDVVITYNGQDHIETFNPHGLIVDEQYGVYYWGYGQTTYEIYDDTLYISREGQETPEAYKDFKFELKGRSDSCVIAETDV